MMAGDWIKMRGNLWDDPRVTGICDLTESSEGAVIGALYWLWATADQHTEDGFMLGLTLRQIDRKTGLQGFASALVSIRWISVCEGGITILRFDEHNGASAKKRCQTARRVANFKASNGEETQHQTNANAHSVSDALPREEKRREEKNKDLERVRTDSREDPGTPTIYGSISREIRHAGVQSNPSHPTFRALVDAGATTAEFLAYVPKALAARGDRFAYLIGCVTSEREKAASLAGRLHLGAMPAVETDYARSMREKYEQLAPSVAARAPGLRAKPIVFDFEVEDVTPRLMG